eukprot:TRINITY_DN41370_c0_g1_i1.p1 TRINITY_DN41370_c0_g1~~TRINITY_DN41370_c0_g1_i1.p1  ORF type:complete len:149 (+),score=42.26 TRINITY_DN41370_c0_g1_i1:158-604(+)
MCIRDSHRQLAQRFDSSPAYVVVGVLQHRQQRLLHISKRFTRQLLECVDCPPAHVSLRMLQHAQQLLLQLTQRLWGEPPGKCLHHCPTHVRDPVFELAEQQPLYASEDFPRELPKHLNDSAAHIRTVVLELAEQRFFDITERFPGQSF